MTNLNTVEIKAFIPAKDFEISKAFYRVLGFTQASESDGIAYFTHGGCSFLLQDFYNQTHAENLMMHLLVEDADAWHQQVIASGLVEKFDTQVTDVTRQPWGMIDFCLSDPGGVLWRIGQNVND